MARLMIDPDKTLEYVSQDDSDKINPTIFRIGRILGAYRTGLFIHLAMGKEVTTDVLFETLKKGLKEIRNIICEDKIKGSVYKDITQIDEQVLGLLPESLLTELFIEILKFNFPSMNRTEKANGS